MPRQPAACGTDSGYYRHRRTGTPICDPCKHAHNTRKKELARNPLGRCGCGTQLRTDHPSCSRCRRKEERAAARAERQQTHEEDHSKPSPDRWVRRGLIWYPVYEQSEVA